MGVISNYIYMWGLVSRFIKETRELDMSQEYKLRSEYIHEFLKHEGIEVVFDRPDALQIGRPCIYIANHSAMIDPAIVLSQMPFPVHFLFKDSLYRVPRFNKVLHREQHIPVHRGSGKQAVIEQIRCAVTDRINHGGSIFIFPEGTRTSTGKMGPFKMGAFLNAVQNNVPIVPLAIHGMFEINPKSSWKMKPGHCDIHVFDPIEVPDGDNERERAEKMRDLAHALLLKDLEG